MYRRAFVITAALCAAATMTIGTIAAASGDAGKKVNFVVHSPIPPPKFMDAYPANPERCTFTPTLVSPCVVPITPTEPSLGAYNDTVTGDFVGIGDFAGSAVLGVFISIPPASTDIPYTHYEPYSLTINRCGKGTVIVQTDGTLDLPDGRWKFVPNSGTGALTGISGSGTFTNTDIATGSFQTSEGKVRCK